jgi:hypothetical protein
MASSGYASDFLCASGNDGPGEQLKEWVGIGKRGREPLLNVETFMHLDVGRFSQLLWCSISGWGLWLHLHLEIKEIFGQRAMCGICFPWVAKGGWSFTVRPCKNLSSLPQPSQSGLHKLCTSWSNRRSETLRPSLLGNGNPDVSLGWDQWVISW